MKKFQFMNNPFKGSGVALVTPFKSDKSIDFEAVKKLIGSSKLKDVQSHFYFYNMEKTGWNIYRPTFEQYGFN
ncbi:MAG: hypothetical protein ACKO4M_08665 [Betaproteobacteria bacterium]